MTKTDKIRRKILTIDDSLGKIEMILRDDDRGHRKLDCKGVRKALGVVKREATRIENLL